MTASRRGPGVLFHLAAGATALFVITVLAMVATVFADPAAPINQWLNRHGAALLMGEVALIVVSACAAMWHDQRQSSRERNDSPHT